MGNWKTDRRVQLAVGLAVVFVAAKWLFSGSLFYAAVDMTAQPADGQTSAGLTISALLPIVFDLAIGGIIFLGSYAINWPSCCLVASSSWWIQRLARRNRHQSRQQIPLSRSIPWVDEAGG